MYVARPCPYLSGFEDDDLVMASGTHLLKKNYATSQHKPQASATSQYKPQASGYSALSWEPEAPTEVRYILYTQD